jgi:hypothetical protein
MLLSFVWASRIIERRARLVSCFLPARTRTIHEITRNRTNKTFSLRVFSWIVLPGKENLSK